MSIVLVLAISLSQFDYLIELRIGAGQSTYDQCETLSGILDGDEQSSDQDENQKEVKNKASKRKVPPAHQRQHLLTSTLSPRAESSNVVAAEAPSKPSAVAPILSLSSFPLPRKRWRPLKDPTNI